MSRKKIQDDESEALTLTTALPFASCVTSPIHSFIHSFLHLSQVLEIRQALRAHSLRPY